MEFGVLGPLVVTAGGTALPLSSTKQRALLAALLCHANTTVSLGRLMEALWEDPPASASENLRLYVYRLRRVLDGPGRITRQGSSYMLAVRPGELDADRFGELAAEGTRARQAGALDRARGLLTEALALWRGTAFGELGQTPLIREVAARLEEERLRVTEERVGVDLDQGRHAELSLELPDLVRAHPYRESLRGHLMLALYRSGRQSEALEVFRQTRTLLGEQLGIEPGPRLRRLHEAMLRGDEDLLLPERRSRALIPHELPAGQPGFTGRAEALKTLDEMLPDLLDGKAGAVVVSAIAGAAGVGKTALAVHWAHQIAERFPDGQLYLNLRGYSPESPLSPAQALTTLLRALGTPPEHVPTETTEAAARYRSLLAGRRMLVVLDNAASAEQVRPLLPGASHCLVLVTSRERLSGLVARDGARRVTLGLFTPVEAEELLTRILGEQRIAMEPEAAAVLAELCDRLPLALRIAAAHLVDRPQRRIADYVEELEKGNRLAALKIEGDSGTAVRAALDLSYAALPPNERRVFRLLGAAPGVDFTPQAAAVAVDLSPDEAERSLDRLVAEHLMEERGPGRYAFHDLVRLHARADAEDRDERAAAVQRVYDWYLSATYSAADVLFGHMMRMPPLWEPHARFAGTGDARAWLDAESANLVAATVEAAADTRQEAWHLALVLRGYLLMSGDIAAGLTTAEAAMTAAQSARDRRGEAAARLALGQAYTLCGRFDEALGHLNHVIALTEEFEWPECRMSALTALGTLHCDRGVLGQAADHYRRALAVSLEHDHWAGQAVAVANLAYVALHEGSLEQAVAYGEHVLERYCMDESRYGQAATLTDLGHACHLLGRFTEALGHFDEALELYRQHGNSVDEPLVLAARAAVHCDLGRYEHALEQAEAAAHTARDAGGRARATALAALGTVHRHLGRLPSALQFLDEALATPEVARYRLLETRIRLERAAARLDACDTAGTVSDAEHALAIARDAGYRVWEGQALAALAGADLADGHVRRATARAGHALALHRETGYRLGQGHTLLLLSEATAGTRRSAAYKAEAERVLAALAS